jgi:hypothetical protein
MRTISRRRYFALASLFVLFAAPAVADEPAAYSTTMGASFGAATVSQGDYWGASALDGGLGATAYLRRPLVDDETPLALQPYLQRLDTVGFSLGFSSFHGDNDRSGYERATWSAAAGVSTRLYLGGLLIGGSFSYSHTAEDQENAAQVGFPGGVRDSFHLLRPGIELGLRSGAFQLTAAYAFDATYRDGNFQYRGWGNAALTAEWVSLRAGWPLYLRLKGYTVDSGGGGFAELELFPSARLGFFLEGYFERGTPYLDSRNPFQNYGGTFGCGWWMSRSAELTISTTVSGEDPLSPSVPVAVRAALNVGLNVRLPRQSPIPEPH